MLKSMWTKVTAPFRWLWSKWLAFEGWVASWMPGFKTMIVTALGAIGSGAALLQEYISGLPVSKFMTETQILIVTIILFTLAFWFRRMTNRDA